MENNTVYHFDGSSLGVEINEGTSEKGCVETEDWGFSVHFVLGFKKIPYTFYI